MCGEGGLFQPQRRGRSLSEAKQGDTVRVHYTGTLDDDTVFDSSRDRDPLEFTIGEGSLIPGFEKAVVGMSPGDVVSARLEAEEAYGERREDLVVQIDRDDLPDGMDPEVGEQLRMRMESGQVIVVRVAETSDASVTVDANHPLAGQPLHFDIELVEIV